MRRILVYALFSLFLGRSALAQSTLDALERDLKQLKDDHQTADSQAMSAFYTALAAAQASPDAALDLYQKAGGRMPDPTARQNRNDYETQSEKKSREAADDAQRANLAYIVQIHCGLMHYAALFLIQPDQTGLQAEWIAWLKSAVAIYQQITPNDFANVEVRSSVITHYLGIENWQDKPPSHWTVHALPGLYRQEVLEPLRTAHQPDVLPAWDTYIAMRQADQSNQDRWNQVDYPALAFERAADDFSLAPSTDKLATLVQILKDHPQVNNLDDLIARVHLMAEGYRKIRGLPPSPAFSATPDTTAAATNAAPAVAPAP